MAAIFIGAAVSVEGSAAGDRDSIEILGIDQAANVVFVGAGLDFFGSDCRIIGQVGASQKRRAGREIQRHAAFQNDRAREIRAGRKIDRAAAGVAATVDCFLDGLGAVRFAVGHGAQLPARSRRFPRRLRDRLPAATGHRKRGDSFCMVLSFLFGKDFEFIRV